VDRDPFRGSDNCSLFQRFSIMRHLDGQREKPTLCVPSATSIRHLRGVSTAKKKHTFDTNRLNDFVRGLRRPRSTSDPSTGMPVLVDDLLFLHLWRTGSGCGLADDGSRAYEFTFEVPHYGESIGSAPVARKQNHAFGTIGPFSLACRSGSFLDSLG